MSAQSRIRLMRPGEEREVCALVARAFDEFVSPDFSDVGIDEFFEYAEPTAMARRRVAGNRVFVAEEEGRIVGMIELMGPDHIAMLFVEKRGRGIGRRLVERGIEACGEADPGVKRITVHASRFAVPIYAKLGFEAQGTERIENGITYVPMVRRVGEGG